MATRNVDLMRMEGKIQGEVNAQLPDARRIIVLKEVEDTDAAVAAFQFIIFALSSIAFVWTFKTRCTFSAVSRVQQNSQMRMLEVVFYRLVAIR